MAESWRYYPEYGGATSDSCCPSCHSNQIRVRNTNWLLRLLEGSWYCRRCRRLFHTPAEGNTMPHALISVADTIFATVYKRLGGLFEGNVDAVCRTGGVEGIAHKWWFFHCHFGDDTDWADIERRSASWVNHISGKPLAKVGIRRGMRTEVITIRLTKGKFYE